MLATGKPAACAGAEAGQQRWPAAGIALRGQRLHRPAASARPLPADQYQSGAGRSTTWCACGSASSSATGSARIAPSGRPSAGLLRLAARRSGGTPARGAGPALCAGLWSGVSSERPLSADLLMRARLSASGPPTAAMPVLPARRSDGVLRLPKRTPANTTGHLSVPAAGARRIVALGDRLERVPFATGDPPQRDQRLHPVVVDRQTHPAPPAAAAGWRAGIRSRR